MQHQHAPLTINPRVVCPQLHKPHKGMQTKQRRPHLLKDHGSGTSYNTKTHFPT
eukprot:TRINITY_DN7252_c0_g1_i1.p2 TRINITY_DN7252_c0_g1~~TRINITY_DN7252_c0_g1_i1.p2  ORF type:complete len:54 (-),score=7.54 TRINITY_DN7252_c0_g1_i1:44-205(-)